jgi:prepilin-type N-terminal cleavage/methylation domain-containing protein
MTLRAKTVEKGFTLIELLIVIAIIGLIAAMLIPNLLDALQKTKQKRTMADMRITGTAMFSWLSDQVGAAAAGASSTQVTLGSYGGVKVASDLTSILVPAYLQYVPVIDGWKAPYDYYVNLTALTSRQVVAIRSKGRDFQASSDSYTVTNFDPTDYDQDIVWADGFMVRWPQK